MRKLVFIFLLLSGWRGFSQGTAMVLDASVRRMPFTNHALVKCDQQKVLFYLEKGMMGVKTNDDTLQLRRINFIHTADPNTATVLSRDEFHNQLYTVTIIQSRDGLSFFIIPFYIPGKEVVRLHSILISSKPCN